MIPTPATVEKFMAPFTEMAERIERNAVGDFSGAVVIVPPDGEPITMMLNDPTKDADAFWSVVSGKVESKIAERRTEHKTGWGHTGARR